MGVVATIAEGNVCPRGGVAHGVFHCTNGLEIVRGHVALEDNRQTQKKSKHQAHGEILDAKPSRQVGRYVSAHCRPRCIATQPVSLMHINKLAVERYSIYSMRRWLLVLVLAAPLPLRSWAGDAMATREMTGAAEPVIVTDLINPQ